MTLIVKTVKANIGESIKSIFEKRKKDKQEKRREGEGEGEGEGERKRSLWQIMIEELHQHVKFIMLKILRRI